MYVISFLELHSRALPSYPKHNSVYGRAQKRISYDLPTFMKLPMLCFSASDDPPRAGAYPGYRPEWRGTPCRFDTLRTEEPTSGEQPNSSSNYGAQLPTPLRSTGSSLPPLNSSGGSGTVPPPPWLRTESGTASHYTILGVAVNASETEIGSAFKRVALLYHPDKYAGEGSTEIFQKVCKFMHKQIDGQIYACMHGRRKRYGNIWL